MSNREIKFRAWQKKEADMLSWNLICQSAFNDNKTSLLYDILVSSKNDFEVMQFTGRQDKNGVDIYEGDITDEGQVIFHNNYLGFFVIHKLKGNTPLYDIPFLEVIGNIHQNPELL